MRGPHKNYQELFVILTVLFTVAIIISIALGYAKDTLII